jgi:hypothetical protein
LSDHPIDARTGPIDPLVRPADRPRHGTLSSLTRRRWVSMTGRLGSLIVVLGVLTALGIGIAVLILVAAVTIAAS